jgi:glycerol-3-phosphate dehydrogenase (NAD(P)+)|tara:strand:+ start:424 stop:1410 length:987 start_codon:yes stop_codon:yes gene_type:complete
MEKIAVIGAGSFGTALSVLLAEKGYDVDLWVRRKELLEKIDSSRKNSQYLKDIKIPENVNCKNSILEVIDNADIVVNAVPSQFTREVTKSYAKNIKKGTIIVNVSKGIELNTCKTMSQVLRDELGEDMIIVTMSGPNHAEELSMKMPTATVVASDNAESLGKIKDIFQTDYFKVFPHDDIIGIEVCSSIKNIAAIATGVCDGLGFGDNARASIITMGLMEMGIFGKQLGAKRATFYGLAGVGDLVASCTSKHGRNRLVGEMLAKGKNLEDIEKEMHGMIAEGIKTTKAVCDFAKKHNLDLPLTEQAYLVLYENKDITLAIKDLLNSFD